MEPIKKTPNVSQPVSHLTANKNVNDKNKKLVEEIVDLKRQIEEYKSKYLRALADYQNFERRVDQEKNELTKTVNCGLILKMLPFLDNLDKAEIFIKDKNLQLIKEQFHKFLKENGVEEIVVLNKEFDPYLAEAMDIVTGEKDNIVVEVLRKGYKFHGKILRVAQVKVSKKL